MKRSRKKIVNLVICFKMIELCIVINSNYSKHANQATQKFRVQLT